MDFMTINEFEKYFNNEFFIIDSNSLNSIENKLYGFLFDIGIVTDCQNINNVTGEGTYIYIKKVHDTIEIFQDFNGNYGLYLFQLGDYFAISNSFLKLVEYLKNKYQLTLNEDYANYFLSSELTSTIYKETLVSEIEMIPRNAIVKINCINKSISFEKVDYAEYSIELNSKSALKLLDEWFDKWVNFIRFLKEKTNNIQVDLSGGFDSRIILALFLSANIDLNKIEIRSFDDGELCHDEDFEISTKIANAFNFKLNNKVISAEKINFKEIRTPIMLSFYTKLGFHNQLNYKFYKTKEPVYNFSGLGGENLRKYIDATPEEYKNIYVSIAKRIDDSLMKSTERIMQSTIENISKEYCVDMTSKNLCKFIFYETRSRHHYGKLSVEDYFSNKFLLMPFFDPNLHKLKLSSNECTDENLLFALIYTRYCPELLNFPFEGNREINKETLEYAQKINEISRFVPREYSFISGPKVDNDKINKYYDVDLKVIRWEADGYYINWEDVEGYLRKIFYSREFKNEFEKYFSPSIYSKISKSIINETYFPLQSAYPAFSNIKIINDIKFSKSKNNDEFPYWLGIFEILNSDYELPFDMKMLHFLLDYLTLRIDIKNHGSANNMVDIIEKSDEHLVFDYPPWFCSDSGKGLVLETMKGELTIKFKCIGNGFLEVNFRGKDVKDKNGIRIPIFIDLVSVLIDSNNVLNENKLVWHDNPHVFKKEVKNNEVISITVKWMPLNKSSLYSN